MKTCKDCIYYEPSEDLEDDDPLGFCHLLPQLHAAPPAYWCGQLKEAINMETHHLVVEWARQPENAVKILELMDKP